MYCLWSSEFPQRGRLFTKEHFLTLRWSTQAFHSSFFQKQSATASPDNGKFWSFSNMQVSWGTMGVRVLVSDSHTWPYISVKYFAQFWLNSQWFYTLPKVFKPLCFSFVNRILWELSNSWNYCIIWTSLRAGDDHSSCQN